MAVNKKDFFTRVRDITAVLTLLGMLISVVIYFMDKSERDAVLRVMIETAIENDENFMEKFKEVDAKFEINAKDHGTYSEHIRIDSD